MVQTTKEQARSQLEQDRQVLRVLATVWGGQAGWVFVTGRKRGYWTEHPRSWDGVGGLDVSLEAGLWPSPDGDIYWCPLVFSEPYRRKEYALPTHVLWADLDEASPDECRLRPSVAWQTSGGDFRRPRYQALWLLALEHGDHPADSYSYSGCPGCHGIPAEQAAALSRRIAYAEPGCDRGGWDVTQVLRLPGTMNFKYDPPEPVKLLWAKRKLYTVSEIETAYPAVPYPTVREFPDYLITRMTDQMWRQVEIEETWARLPVGLRYALKRAPDGDRSAELFRLAQQLLHFGVEPAAAVYLLKTSPNNKFAGRSDELVRLQAVVRDALDKPMRTP